MTSSRKALILSLPGRLLEEMGLELEAWESRVIVEHAEWVEVGGARCQRGPDTGPCASSTGELTST